MRERPFGGALLAFEAVGWATAWSPRAKERQTEPETAWWRRIEASHPEIAERTAFGADWQRRNPEVTPVA